MLEGKTIWITRPEGQAQSLVKSLEDDGANIVSLPMLAIEPLPVNQTIRQKVLALDNYDLLVFISTNAAKLGLEIIHDFWPQFPVQLPIYAVGPTTADVVGEYGLEAEFPRQRMSSEALLALDSLADIVGKKALIVRGVGGRELLAESLRARGASVDYLEIYRRVCPDYAGGKLAALVKNAHPAAVIVTSAEALGNLTDLMTRDQLSPESVRLFVSSGRIADIAAQKGFSHTITMSGADDKAIIESLAANV